MSFSGEQTYRIAVRLAEGTRQQSKAAAFVTYGFDPALLAAYKIALADADVAFITAVNTAANTADIQLGNIGYSGPIPGADWSSLLAIA